MSIASPFQGSLFVNDFLCESIVQLPDWREIDDKDFDIFKTSIGKVFDRFPTSQTPNESQTEDDLIWPVLGQLGWRASLRQQNLSAHGREDVPDGLLFADDAAKDRANGFPEEMIDDNNMASIPRLHEKLGWSKRRLNPAVARLMQFVAPGRTSREIQNNYPTTGFVLDAEDRFKLKRFIERQH